MTSVTSQTVRVTMQCVAGGGAGDVMFFKDSGGGGVRWLEAGLAGVGVTIQLVAPVGCDRASNPLSRLARSR